MPDLAKPRIHSPLALWHLLSLDAPTVATLWTWFIARCCGLRLTVAALAAMFLAVWMLYVADRLLDAQTPSDLEARHHFHHQHRRAFLIATGVAALALGALLPQLLPAALKLYTTLAALLFAWFLLIHTRIAPSRRLPKELAVGIFFPAAVFIPVVARRPDLRVTLIIPALLFASICTLNCLYLYAWEHPTDRTNAHWTTRFATHHLTFLAIASVSIATLCIPFRVVAFAFPAACATSAALLILLHRHREKLSPTHLRAAADLALLTPLLFAFLA